MSVAAKHWVSRDSSWVRIERWPLVAAALCWQIRAGQGEQLPEQPGWRRHCAAGGLFLCVNWGCCGCGSDGSARQIG
jgi:hypothetical protein